MQVAQSLQGCIRYEYSDITGRKVETRSYAALSDALSGNDEDTTRIEYTYDELGRLFETVVVKRDGTELATPEVTTSYFGCVKPFQIFSAIFKIYYIIIYPSQILPRKKYKKFTKIAINLSPLRFC